MTNIGGISHPEKIAPHSAEAEEAVLGSVLINADALYDVAAFLSAADFFIVRNGWVWNAIAAIAGRNDAVDYLTVVDELRKRGQLDSVGGSAYLTYLVNNTPTHIHAETYARLVERAAIRRRLLAAASDIAQTALEENAEIDDLLTACDATYFGAVERRGANDLTTAQTLASRAFDRTEYLYHNRGKILGLPTGLESLDAYLGGYQKSRLYLLAARPGVGKTAFMLNNSVRTIAGRLDKKVVVLSLEMNEDQVYDRLAAAESGLDSEKIRNGNLNDREWALYTEATGNIGRWPLWVKDDPNVTVARMRALLRKHQRREGLDLVVVDYLQLMSADKKENRTQEISFISRNLKILARELNVPVVAACQMSRAVENRADHEPQLSDLRESGTLEQDADVVVFIYQCGSPENVKFKVGKNRDGNVGVFPAFFKKETTEFIPERPVGGRPLMSQPARERSIS